MIRFDLLSAVPDILTGPLDYSIVGRAKVKGLVEVCVHDLRTFTTDKHRKIDDYPFGGGAGMVLTPQPIVDAVRWLQKQRTYDEIIFVSPDGEPFKQADANRISMMKNVLILCGHYKGVDQRVRDLVITKEFSVGDVVLSGGEIPAMMIVDAAVRLLPGALGDSESALLDSFQDGMLDAPWYTRPAVYEGLEVPDVLQSGNHKKIDQWRFEQALQKTKTRRPDILKENL